MSGEPLLPLDSDIEVDQDAAGRPKPALLSWGNIGLVAAGGAVGTGLRYLISSVVPHVLGLPVAIFVINVTGAFILGLLLELLAEHGSDVGWSQRVRLGIGTGVLGGFTTYSALATDAMTLAIAHPGLAASYAIATIVIGGIASWAGIALSRFGLRPALARQAGRP